MNPQRQPHWQEIERIFDEAVARTDDERAAFVEAACAGDEALRREIEALLAADQKAQQAPNFLASPLGATLPTKLGAYQLQHEIARGGMGAVWLAHRADEQFEQRVAIKLLHAGANNEDLQRRFQHERQILADLNHPNIARLLDGGTTAEGQPYFVMEYIEGLPIDEYCQQQQLSVRDRLQLFRQVCNAVQYAHQHLIIHRDLKPGNILVTASADGNGVTPKLLDFGVAKLLQPDLTASHHTQSGVTPMTPAYASPEQIRGDKLTTASDVYSLGVVLYELLTGRSPYQLTTSTFGELSKAICEQEPLRPSTARMRDEGGGMNRKHESSSLILHPSSLRGDLDSIVLMALRKEPTARYASVEQFSADIQRYLDGLPTLARKGTLAYRAVKYVRRYKVPVAVAALLLLSLVGGIGATSRQSQIARAAQAKAEAQQIRAEQALAVAGEQRRRAEQALAEMEAQRTRAENALTTAEQRRQQAEAAHNEAEEQRKEAEAQRVAAEDQRARATQGEETKRQLLYAAQMRLAQQAWEASDMTRMQELLDAQLPQPEQRDLRGLEWYYLWRLGHSEIATIKPISQVSSIVLTPDGTKMAAQINHGDIRIWDTATGKELAPIHYPNADSHELAISPDGKLLAQSLGTGQIKIFAVSNSDLLSTLEFRQQGELGKITFSPDGKLLAVATENGMVGVWAVSDWQQQASFKASSQTIRALVFTPDSKQLLTGGDENVVKVWNPLSGQELRAIPQQFGVNSLAFIPGSNRIVSAHRNPGETKIWDFATGRLVVMLSKANGASCSPDGKLIATNQYESVVRLWNAQSGALLTELKTHGGAIYLSAFTPDSKGLFTYGIYDATLRLWNVQAVSDAKFLAYSPFFHNVAFTQDGHRLITTNNAQEVRIYDAKTGKELQKLEGHKALPMAPNDGVTMAKVVVSPVGGYFATSGYDGTVRTWEEKTGKPLQVFDARTRGLYGLAISPDGRYIASGGSDKLMRIWDTVTGCELHTLRGHEYGITTAAISPQGHYLATCDSRGYLKLWDYMQGVELRTLRPFTNYVRTVTFSPDGKLLALGGEERDIALLDTTTWQTVRTLNGHTMPVNTIQFSPDGKRLIASGRDYTTRVWELEQGQEVLVLRQHENLVMDVALAPDGTSFVTAGGDGKLLRWPMVTPREVLARISGEQPLRANVSEDAIQDLLAHPPEPLVKPVEMADQKINGWDKGGSTPALYATLLDTAGGLSNKTSAMLMSKWPAPKGSASLAQSIRADHYRGKRVRFSGYLKTREPFREAIIWFGIGGAGVNSLEYGNASKIISTEWTKLEVVLDVPEDALTLNFGFMMFDSGVMWGDDFRLEIVDENVPTTGNKGQRERDQHRFILLAEAERTRLTQQAQENAKRLPMKPINMDFEQ